MPIAGAEGEESTEHGSVTTAEAERPDPKTMAESEAQIAATLHQLDSEDALNAPVEAPLPEETSIPEPAQVPAEQEGESEPQPEP